MSGGRGETAFCSRPRGEGRPGLPSHTFPQGPTAAIGPPRWAAAAPQCQRGLFHGGTARSRYSRPLRCFPVVLPASSPPPGAPVWREGGSGHVDPPRYSLHVHFSEDLAGFHRFPRTASSQGGWGVPWPRSWSLVQQLHRNKRGLPLKPGV